MSANSPIRLYIAIGTDSRAAQYLQKTRRRTYSFPFNTVVSYGGVSTCLRERFQRFLPVNSEGFNAYDMSFPHDYIARDGLPDKNTDDKYRRRWEIMQRSLQTCTRQTHQLIFWRNGHMSHHHHEHNGKYDHLVSAEIRDAEQLSLWLQTTFPEMDYRILLTLNCPQCFPRERVEELRSSDSRLYISVCPQEDAWEAEFESLLATIPLTTSPPS